ncbi:MAG: hypothetical protein AAFX94_22705, partial [Myxococcota bacterium]
TQLLVGILVSIAYGEANAQCRYNDEVNERASSADGRIAAVLYENTEFKVAYHDLKASTSRWSYGKGDVESFVVYPGCKLFFFNSDHLCTDKSYATKDYDAPSNSGAPYYVTSPKKKLREKWNAVATACESNSQQEGAFAWSEISHQGQYLPLFPGQDWTYPAWFKGRVSSIQVMPGYYVVVYTGDDVKTTSLVYTQSADSANLNDFQIDNMVTKTEVKKFDDSEGVIGCFTARGCYRTSDTCDSREGPPPTVVFGQPGLSTCGDDIGGQSYCTDQFRCVDASTGKPKTFADLK